MGGNTALPVEQVVNEIIGSPARMIASSYLVIRFVLDRPTVGRLVKKGRWQGSLVCRGRKQWWIVRTSLVRFLAERLVTP